MLEKSSDDELYALALALVQSKIYQDTFPGLKNSYHNEPINDLLSRICEWGISDRAKLETALRWMRYRFEVMMTANHFVSLLGIRRPGNHVCEDFNVQAFENGIIIIREECWVVKDRYGRYWDLHKWFCQESLAAYRGSTAARMLFPEPEGDSEDEDSEDDTSKDIRDIRLGDVVISLHSKSAKAVVQYNFGKSARGGEFIRTGTLNKPPNIVLGAVAMLQGQHRRKGHNISEHLSKMFQRIEVWLRSSTIRVSTRTDSLN